MFDINTLASKVASAKTMALVEQITHIPPATTISIQITKYRGIIKTMCNGEAIYVGQDALEAVEKYMDYFQKSESWLPKNPLENGFFS